MKILEINHCRKHFGDNEVLKDISLSVEKLLAKVKPAFVL